MPKKKKKCKFYQRHKDLQRCLFQHPDLQLVEEQIQLYYHFILFTIFFICKFYLFSFTFFFNLSFLYIGNSILLILGFVDNILDRHKCSCSCKSNTTFFFFLLLDCQEKDDIKCIFIPQKKKMNLKKLTKMNVC